MLKLFGVQSNRGIQISLRRRYIRQKDIDEICSGYGETKSQKMKMYAKMFAHIGKQGYQSAWKDFKDFNELSNKPKSQRTKADWNRLIRMRHDMYCLVPIVIIQILPMSAPLFILYMYTYPGSVPSWFTIDQAHQRHELSIRQAQKKAVNYFRSRSLTADQIDYNSMSLEQARKLAECLYGYYRDGTKGYNKLFGKSISYILTEGFSKYLIKRKLRFKFGSDLQYQDILSKKKFDEKIRWKYQHVVQHGNLMKPYLEILSAEDAEALISYKKQVQRKQMQQKQQLNDLSHQDNKQNGK